PLSTLEEGGTSLPGEEIHPIVVEVQKETTSNTDPHGGGVPPTHTDVDQTHSHGPPTPMGVGGTPLPGGGIHPIVVEVQKETTSNTDPHGGGVPPTHTSVDPTHAQIKIALHSPV